MTRTRTRKREPPEVVNLRADITRLETELRQSLIHRIIDLEVAAGTRHEKTREQRAVEMADPNRLPLHALEEIRRSILAILAVKNHTATTTSQEACIRPEYVQ